MPDIPVYSVSPHLAPGSSAAAAAHHSFSSVSSAGFSLAPQRAPWPLEHARHSPPASLVSRYFIVHTSLFTCTEMSMYFFLSVYLHRLWHHRLAEPRCNIRRPRSVRFCQRNFARCGAVKRQPICSCPASCPFLLTVVSS